MSFREIQSGGKLDQNVLSESQLLQPDGNANHDNELSEDFDFDEEGEGFQSDEANTN